MATTAATGNLHSIGDADFNAIRDLIHREAGVSLSDAKRALVCSRLSKRLRYLQLNGYGDYLDYLQFRDPNGEELQVTVNCLTTNKTDFFRERHHFDFLRDDAFPELLERVANGRPRKLRIWSAGCSQGDEPYTIAMTVLEHLPSAASWDVRILASDINTDVLDTAKAGIYAEEKLAPLPAGLKEKYFSRGTGTNSGTCCVRPELQRLIAFRQINLMQPWAFRSTFDIVFCRNVIIYFNQETQRRLLTRFSELLGDSGYLILGHSENQPWLSEQYDSCGSTIYRRRRQGVGSGLPAVDSGRDKRGTVPMQDNRRTEYGISRRRPPSSTAQIGKSAAGGGQSVCRQCVPQKNFVSVSAPPRQAYSASVAGSLPRHNVIAGEACVLNTPGEIATVLGSCVAACLYDPDTGIGGMNHFILPSRNMDEGANARYGIHAMELLITGLMNLGAERSRLNAKVFGGAEVLKMDSNLCQIGRRNAEFVREFLSTERICLVAEKLGGTSPLRVHFLPHTGQAFVKTVERNFTLAQSERQLIERANREAESAGSITLF